MDFLIGESSLLYFRRDYDLVPEAGQTGIRFTIKDKVDQALMSVNRRPSSPEQHFTH